MQVQRLKAEVEAGKVVAGMAKGRGKGKGKGKAKADLLASSTNQASLLSPTSNIQQKIKSTRISVLSDCYSISPLLLVYCSVTKDKWLCWSR